LGHWTLAVAATCRNAGSFLTASRTEIGGFLKKTIWSISSPRMDLAAGISGCIPFRAAARLGGSVSEHFAFVTNFSVWLAIRDEFCNWALAAGQ
jgi:hypothetical protein